MAKREESTYHYAEMFDNRGVYHKTPCDTAQAAEDVVERWRMNSADSRAAGTWPKDHGVRAVTETLIRTILD